MGGPLKLKFATHFIIYQKRSGPGELKFERTIQFKHHKFLSKLEYCMKMHPSSRVLQWKKNDLNLWKIMMKSENCYCRNQEGILVKTWIYCIKGKYLTISFFINATSDSLCCWSVLYIATFAGSPPPVATTTLFCCTISYSLYVGEIQCKNGISLEKIKNFKTKRRILVSFFLI